MFFKKRGVVLSARGQSRHPLIWLRALRAKWPIPLLPGLGRMGCADDIDPILKLLASKILQIQAVCYFYGPINCHPKILIHGYYTQSRRI
jgi:hypothetical protein